MSKASSNKGKQRSTLRYCRAAAIFVFLAVFSVASMGSISPSLPRVELSGMFGEGQSRGSNMSWLRTLPRSKSTIERRLGAYQKRSDEMPHPSQIVPTSLPEVPPTSESSELAPQADNSSSNEPVEQLKEHLHTSMAPEEAGSPQLQNGDEPYSHKEESPHEETTQSTISPESDEHAPTVTTPVTPFPIVEETDCTKLAPCQSGGDDRPVKCVTFYAKRFWDAAPSQISDNLRYHREHRPENTWYETEMLMFQRVEESQRVMPPHKDGVCTGALPDKVTYLHNFKVAGTTARHALGVYGYPGYEVKSEIYSDNIDSMFPTIVNATREDYRDYVDTMKKEIYDSQQINRDDNMAFTFVRNPVQRFISALEQILRHNNTEWELSDESQHCLDATDHFHQIECFAKSMMETRVFFNVHLYPQAYLFDTWTKYGAYDTAFTVLDLKAMDPLFKRFTGRNIRRWRESKVDGTQYNFGERDLAPPLAALICQLYEVDVIMLRALGMEDPLCAKVMSVSSQ